MNKKLIIDFRNIERFYDTNFDEWIEKLSKQRSNYANELNLLEVLSEFKEEYAEWLASNP